MQDLGWNLGFASCMDVGFTLGRPTLKSCGVIFSGAIRDRRGIGVNGNYDLNE